MLLDVRPLRKYRDFRLLFAGQFVSYLGSMVSYVAVPYQVYQLTKDNWLVGMLGVVQLAPVLVFGILGGTYADRLNRRKLLLVSECLMSLLALGLALNALRPEPSVPAIFVLVALFQAVAGFHRPAMDAQTQKMVEPRDYGAVGALGSFRGSVGAIAGPAIGGVLIAAFGAQGAYLFDFVSFLLAFASIWFWVALLFLALAGGADMMSGLFRSIIWNETVPNQLRGRLSGIEMISYMSGPLLGNARAGWMAAHYGVPVSIGGGGAICTVAVIATAFCLLKFWRYRGTS
jgi:MFS family permease